MSVSKKHSVKRKIKKITAVKPRIIQDAPKSGRIELTRIRYAVKSVSRCKTK